MIIKQYFTQEEIDIAIQEALENDTIIKPMDLREVVIAEQELANNTLVESQNHGDGNFLIFQEKTKWHTRDIETGDWIFNLEQYLTEVVKPKRDNELVVTDYLMLTDTYALLSAKEKTDLVNYRQQLRDLTSSVIDEASALALEWPVRFTLGAQKKRWYNASWEKAKAILLMPIGRKKL